MHTSTTPNSTNAFVSSATLIESGHQGLIESIAYLEKAHPLNQHPLLSEPCKPALIRWLRSLGDANTVNYAKAYVHESGTRSH